MRVHPSVEGGDHRTALGRLLRERGEASCSSSLQVVHKWMLAFQRADPQRQVSVQRGGIPAGPPSIRKGLAPQSVINLKSQLMPPCKCTGVSDTGARNSGLLHARRVNGPRRHTLSPRSWDDTQLTGAGGRARCASALRFQGHSLLFAVGEVQVHLELKVCFPECLLHLQEKQRARHLGAKSGPRAMVSSSPSRGLGKRGSRHLCSQQDPHACPVEFWLTRGLARILCSQTRGEACLQNKHTQTLGEQVSYVAGLARSPLPRLIGPGALLSRSRVFHGRCFGREGTRLG